MEAGIGGIVKKYNHYGNERGDHSMIRFRRGRVHYCRYISLLVCMVMISGLFLSFSPQPAAASSADLASYLQSLYNKVSPSEISTLRTIYNNAVSLAVYDPSNPGALPWATVFAPGNLDVTTLANTGYGGDVNAAATAVSYLLRDYAEMVYYGSQGTYSASVIDNFWNEDNNAQTISKIVGSPVSEDSFSDYMIASMNAIPAAAESLLGSLSAVEKASILYNIAYGNISDPGTNNFLQDCIASALDGTASGGYAQFNANPSGAGWSFGSDLINKGYRFVDGFIGIVNGQRVPAR